MPRPIQSKPSAATPSLSGQDEPISTGPRATSTPSVSHPTPSSSAAQSKPRRRQTHIACNGCRVARAKCDGGRPCTRCRGKGADDCIYEADQGETRMGSLRRRIQDSEDEVSFLRNLIDTGWDTAHNELRRRVREGPSAQDRFSSMHRQESVRAKDDQAFEQSGLPAPTPLKGIRRASSFPDLPDGVGDEVEEAGEDVKYQEQLRPGRAPDNIDPRLREPGSSYDFTPSYRGNLTPDPQATTSPSSQITPPAFNQLQTLYDSSLRFPSLVGDFTEKLDDHIAILAVTRGWSAVEEAVALDPQWRIIANIDLQRHQPRPLDRLGVVRMLRLLMKYYASTPPDTTVVESLLPDWAKPTRLQQSTSYPNLIRFIFWPQVRDQLILNRHLVTPSFYASLYFSLRLNFEHSKPSDRRLTDDPNRPNTQHIPFTPSHPIHPTSHPSSYSASSFTPITGLAGQDLTSLYTQQDSNGILSLSNTFRSATMNLDNWRTTVEWLDAYPMFRGVIGEFDKIPSSSALGPGGPGSGGEKRKTSAQHSDRG